MTEFASIHPETYGHTNRVRAGVVPALCACGRVSRSMSGHWIEITTNDPNPILLDVRAAVSRLSSRPDWSYILRRFEEWVTQGGAYITLDYVRITNTERIEHARRVLTRLATLARTV